MANVLQSQDNGINPRTYLQPYLAPVSYSSTGSLQPTDQGKTINLSAGTAPYTVTLPTPASTSGGYFYFRNITSIPSSAAAVLSVGAGSMTGAVSAIRSDGALAPVACNGANGLFQWGSTAAVPLLSGVQAFSDGVKWNLSTNAFGAAAASTNACFSVS